MGYFVKMGDGVGG